MNWCYKEIFFSFIIYNSKSCSKMKGSPRLQKGDTGAHKTQCPYFGGNSTVEGQSANSTR